MNSKGIGCNYACAWENAQIAVMGAEGAVDILHKKRIAEANDPNFLREHLVREYEEHFMTPYIAAQRGFIDEVILPEETRKKLSESFFALKDKNEMKRTKKHGNIPL